tara:strand:- start:3134 stop:3412 length:279 start_codon:yes stop_codon:yes gene_type:complete
MGNLNEEKGNEMPNDINVSLLLIESAIQAIEELMHDVDSEAVQPDHQAVLTELTELLQKVNNASEEEGTEATMEAAAEPAVDAEVLTEPAEA